MSFSFVVIVAGVAAAGYYGYRKLVEIEEEIREELASKGMAADEETPPQEPPKPVVPKKETKPATLEDQILEHIRLQPGVLQTDLYKQFPDSDRKAVQKVLLKMDRTGVIKRTKDKSTYVLNVA
jgi:hypothetical protein